MLSLNKVAFTQSKMPIFGLLNLGNQLQIRFMSNIMKKRRMKMNKHKVFLILKLVSKTKKEIEEKNQQTIIIIKLLNFFIFASFLSFYHLVEKLPLLQMVGEIKGEIILPRYKSQRAIVIY